jgi:phytoene/squalene synthetase
MMKNLESSHTLAESITKAASKQTYYTIRFLADRKLFAHAYRAYAYFRWVDDVLDAESHPALERTGFIDRQKRLLEGSYRGETQHDISPEEKLLVELVQSDGEKTSGLQSYLRNMMALMSFDADRRGRVISQSELNEYTRCLASAVTEAMHYFIGHRCVSPHNETRYLAVSAAHITHMLRDTFDDIQAGYFNIPLEVLEANHITPQDVNSAAYRTWVRSRVQLAQDYFRMGKEYLGQVENRRCRLAGYAYVSRFESVLDSIERDGYVLRPSYPERKGLGAILRASRSILTPFIFHHANRTTSASVPAHPHTLREP